MSEAITRFFIQQGSSCELHVSDEDAWYVVRQTWPNIDSALSRCEIETKCASRQEALDLAEIYNSPEEPLSTLAGRSGISYDTLVKAAQAKRLNAHKNGKVWISTWRAVYEFGLAFVAKPRR